VTVIHDVLETAVQGQPPRALTVAVIGPPAAGTVVLDSDAENEQFSVSCVIVKRAPAIVIEPTRAVPVKFGDIVYVTAPTPVPSEGLTSIHELAAEAFQLQFEPEDDIATVPLVPAAGAVVGTAPSWKLHSVGAGFATTVTFTDATRAP
jgi:hypothetical protein